MGKKPLQHLNSIDAALVNAALKAYLTSNPGKSQTWIRHPNNLISVVAIVLSVLGVVYGFYKDWRDSIDRNLQALTGITTDLAKLNTEYFATTGQSAREDGKEQYRLGEIARSLASRRFALLAQADRLTAELGDKVPGGQLSVLGVAFDEAYEFDKAVQYFEKTTTPSNSTILRVLGWRSIGLVNIKRGSHFYQAAREAFYKAINVAPELEDYVSAHASLEVYEQWSQFELDLKKDREAIQILLQGRERISRYSCQANMPDILAMFDDLIQSAIKTIKTHIPNTSDLLSQEVDVAKKGADCLQ